MTVCQFHYILVDGVSLGPFKGRSSGVGENPGPSPTPSPCCLACLPCPFSFGIRKGLFPVKSCEKHRLDSLEWEALIPSSTHRGGMEEHF